jgi:hypothetical protein
MLCSYDILFFSLEEKNQKNRPFCKARLYTSFLEQKLKCTSTRPFPFAIPKLRDDAHPFVEALKYQVFLAAKRPEKECFFRGIRKIAVSECQSKSKR